MVGRAARVSVFFLDETQRVQWNAVGSERRILAAATKFRANVHPPFTLAAQFRCGGSDGYLNWLDDVLQIRATGNYDNWADDQYVFRVFDDARMLYEAIRSRNSDNKARLVAGYSWEWPTEGRQRRGDVRHVAVDGLSLPWNFSGENWATASDGIEQVGCVHTCQGVEFDWLGVLIGPDLRLEKGRIVGDPTRRARTDTSLKGWKTALENAEGDAIARAEVLDKVQSIIKNTYKVLLSRGRKGCFVWCADAALRDYLRERVRLALRSSGAPAPRTAAPGRPPAPHVEVLPQPTGEPFRDCLPVYELRAAAGTFGPSVAAEPLGWVVTPQGIRADNRHFVSRVHGQSMEPLIPDGAYCVFRLDVAGSRTGRILLVEHHMISDPESGGSYTVKKYRSLKIQEEEASDDPSWCHRAIQLLPLNQAFPTIWVNPDQAQDLRVVAEFVCVVNPI